LADRNAWSRASLRDRVFGGRRILRGQPEAHFLETTASSLRRPVWDCSLPLHVLGGDAALGLSQASILDFRNNHRGRHSYRLRRASDISHCPPVLKPRNSADIAGSAVIAENGWETYRRLWTCSGLSAVLSDVVAQHFVLVNFMSPFGTDFH
jgi:hypothetical protein